MEVPLDMGRDELRRHLREGTSPTGSVLKHEPLPFEPLRPYYWNSKRGGRSPVSCQWMFSCPMLRADGRCGVYEQRPDVCRKYEPGTDRMCAEFEGSWKGLLRIRGTANVPKGVK